MIRPKSCAKTFRFRGYVHLKIMPGAEKGQVERAMQLANRLSVNLEAPNDSRLHKLAPLKKFEMELLRPLRWIEEIRHTQPAQMGWNGRWPSSTTQFVVGGGDETDLELLSTSEFLFRNLRLQRTYYSAFNPVPDTPLENRPAEDPLRQHRLYQASFLFRDYGFGLEELPFTSDGNLPREIDPKLAWARENLQYKPLEVNDAGRQDLLRVPGIGPQSATTILRARRQGTLRDLRDLRKLGVRTSPMEPYVLLDGKRPHSPTSTNLNSEFRSRYKLEGYARQGDANKGTPLPRSTLDMLQWCTIMDARFIGEVYLGRMGQTALS